MSEHHFTYSAEWEFHRLRNASAWSPHPISDAKHCWRNQHWSHYLFADGSRLDIYNNGTAAWHSPDGCRHIKSKRFAWHFCNAHRSV